MSAPSRDWADELAHTIIGEVLVLGDPRQLLATRLRIVHEQGVSDGLKRIEDAMKRADAMVAA